MLIGNPYNMMSKFREVIDKLEIGSLAVTCTECNCTTVCTIKA